MVDRTTSTTTEKAAIVGSASRQEGNEDAAVDHSKDQDDSSPRSSSEKQQGASPSTSVDEEKTNTNNSKKNAATPDDSNSRTGSVRREHSKTKETTTHDDRKGEEERTNIVGREEKKALEKDSVVGRTTEMDRKRRAVGGIPEYYASGSDSGRNANEGTARNTRRKRGGADAAHKEGDVVDKKSDNNANDDDEKNLQFWEEWHRKFVETIFEVGLKHASPSVIMEQMTQLNDAVTSERVKSHLQKYRNNRVKSEAEFMEEYDRWMKQKKTETASGQTATTTTSRLLGGDAAAFVSYSVMRETGILNSEVGNSVSTGAVGAARDQTGAGTPPALTENDTTGEQEPALSRARAEVRNQSHEYARRYSGARIPHPVLTDDERNSPLGQAIGQVVSLFRTMTAYVVQERVARQQHRSGGRSVDAAVPHNAPTASYHANASFVHNTGVSTFGRQHPQTLPLSDLAAQMSAFPWVPAVVANAQQQQQPLQRLSQRRQSQQADLNRFQSTISPFNTDSITPQMPHPSSSLLSKDWNPSSGGTGQGPP